MTDSGQLSVPDWDLEQIEVILEPPSSWQLVIAGPGTGKSAVACQRVAFLVDEATPPSRILLVSFTRTAVAELRDRIISYADTAKHARAVKISTIDSHAWNLRVGFDEEPLAALAGDDSYDLGIQRTIDLLESKHSDLIDFLARLEHLIIDEAQDVMGVRADLVLEILKNLAPTCGVTILADPLQAIYGFTTDSRSENTPMLSLLERLAEECPRSLVKRTLKNTHRIKDDSLVDLFLTARKEIESAEKTDNHVAHVQDTIRGASGHNIGRTTYDNLADFLTSSDDEPELVLFRRRADVLFASSYSSKANVEHRLRMSNVPQVVRPWVGWLLGDAIEAIISREDFNTLWSERAELCEAPFAGVERDPSWTLLHRLAAGNRPNSLDLMHLRNIVARSRPPIELCYTELGSTGPILGTIHASKGREANNVVLVMPLHQQARSVEPYDTDAAAVYEEGRVYYVGATRARNMLITAEGPSVSVGYLESRRVYCGRGDRRAQLEIGRTGDVDKLAHLAWSSCVRNQLRLAAEVGQTTPVIARAVPEEDFALRICLGAREQDGSVVNFPFEVGQLSEEFQVDLKALWRRLDSRGELRPADKIANLYMVAVGTVGLSEQERGAVKPPFNQSGMALTPVIKGFPMVNFVYRRGRRHF
ncbi:UvrD-helicase domain-containing protein [Candidatus Bipolaricaulota bacterium]